MRITPKWLLLVLTIARAASAAGEREVAEKLIDRITQQEEQFVQELRTHTAILETYIQETPDPSVGDGSRGWRT